MNWKAFSCMLISGAVFFSISVFIFSITETRTVYIFSNGIATSTCLGCLAGYLLSRGNYGARTIARSAGLTLSVFVLCNFIGRHMGGQGQWREFLSIPLSLTLAFGWISGILVFSGARKKILLRDFLPLFWAVMTGMLYFFPTCLLGGWPGSPQEWAHRTSILIALFPSAILAGTYVAVSPKTSLAFTAAAVATVTMTSIIVFDRGPIPDMLVPELGYLAAFTACLAAPRDAQAMIILAFIGLLWTGPLHFVPAVLLLGIGLVRHRSRKSSGRMIDNRPTHARTRVQ
ncbi:hypothetical protein ACFL4G_06875 [Thermodesulfobacteriota bacterium]